MGKKSRRKDKPAKQRMPFVARTFEGLPGEADWIAMREFVPSATAAVRLLGTERTVRVCSLLPGASAGLVRPDGEIWVGLQVAHNFGDISRDLASVVETGLEAEPGTPLRMTDPGVGARLQDLVDPASPFDVEVHDVFDWWVEGTDDSAQAKDLLTSANETIAPTVRLEGVDGAYATDMGGRRYLRWVMTHDEAPLLDAFSRLRARGADGLGEGTKLIGMFRAHGLLVPVWEFEDDAETLIGPAQAFAPVLAEALADGSPLTTEQRSARNGLTSRQLTIR